MASEHKNSKIVTIFRAGSFLSRAQNKEVDDFLSTAKRSIGSCWESASSKKVGTGLDFNEEALLLPLVLDVPAEDREFRKKVTQFYVDIDTQVPHKTGKALEVGLLESNEKSVGAKNMPINIMDYLRYRQIMIHPKVALTKDDAEGNPLKEFYIFDKTDTIKKNIKAIDEKDAAFTIYLEVKNNPEKVKELLTVLGVDPREFTGSDVDKLRSEALRKKAEDDPATFCKTYKEEDLEIRAWIKAMVNTEVFKLIGAKIVDGETNKLVGNNVEEVIFYFKDDENSDMVGMYKARLQEAMRKPLASRPKNR